MSSAFSTLVIDSSRQIGVLSARWSSAWRMMSSNGQRLLDHDQVEFVELLERLDVAKREGVVRVGHERRIGKRLSHCAHELDIVARLDLQLDLVVALLDRAPRALDERCRAALDAERDARLNACACAADELRQRLLARAWRRAPTRPSRRRPSPCCGRGSSARARGCTSDGCAYCTPSTRGATYSVIAYHAVSIVSEV